MTGELAASVLAAIVDAPGAEPRVGHVDQPTRRPGTSLLEVVAAPLNPLDVVVASGKFHSMRHESPYVPGSECVGLVLESETFAPGSMVYAECHASPSNPGPFATRVLVADDDSLPLPDGLDPVLAAAVGNAGIAAFMSLVEYAGLQTGESVMILGATGAVGQIAIQIARLKGAACVIGVGRDGGTLEELLALGANAVVVLRDGEAEEDLAARLLGAGGPVDVVLDGLYGEPLQAALRACAPRARVVNIGNPAGATAQIPAGLLRGKQLTLAGFAGVLTPFPAKRQALSWLWTAVRRGDLRIKVDTFPLEETPAAWLTQNTSPHTKLVMVPGPSRTPSRHSLVEPTR